MRFKLTLILLALNLVLFAAILYFSKPGATSLDKADRLVLAPELVENLTRAELSGPALTSEWILVKQDNGWFVEAPKEWPANTYAMDRLLSQLRFLEWETRFPVRDLENVGQSLADYGLEDPVAVVQLQAGTRSESLRIGVPTEIGNRLYIQTGDGEQIYVVDRELFHSVASDLDSFYDRQIMPIPAFEARGLTIQDGTRGNVSISVVRQDAEQWSFESPFQAPANPEAVVDVIETLQSLQVQQFVAPDLAAAGLLNSRLRVTVAGNNRRVTLLIGETVEEDAYPRLLYARRSDLPTVFTVNAEPFEVLRRAQETLRRRQILVFDPAAVNTVEIRSFDRNLTLQQLENGSWQVVYTDDEGDPHSLPADPGVVEELIAAVRQLEAVSFVTDAPSESDLGNFGLKDPQRVLTLKTKEGAPLVLRVGDLAPDSNTLYARRDDAPTVFSVRPLILYELKTSPLSYRERTLSTLPPAAEILRIRLVDTRNAEEPVTLLDYVPSREPESELDAREREARTVVESYLREFEVKDFLRTGFESPLQLDRTTSVPLPFRLEAEVRLPGARETQEGQRIYLLSERLGGTTQFGATENPGAVFTLRQELIDALALWMQPEPPEGFEDVPSGQEPIVPPEPEPATESESAGTPGL